MNAVFAVAVDEFFANPAGSLFYLFRFPLNCHIFLAREKIRLVGVTQ